MTKEEQIGAAELVKAELEMAIANTGNKRIKSTLEDLKRELSCEIGNYYWREDWKNEIAEDIYNKWILGK
ncbi:MAG: hypothetical protein GY799_17180 [Desulfobulbaceae bacterium]|jgi:hypothetical protein|nr:hypothetical protein [Desulfobulbaceae bacterium]